MVEIGHVLTPQDAGRDDRRYHRQDDHPSMSYIYNTLLINSSVFDRCQFATSVAVEAVALELGQNYFPDLSPSVDARDHQ